MDVRRSDADEPGTPSGGEGESNPHEGDSATSVPSTERGGANAETGAIDPPTAAPGRPEPPSAKEVEMGGEAACQLHRWWDEEED